MIRIYFVLATFALVCTGSPAAGTPLAVKEVNVEREVSAADAQVKQAELKLVEWRLQQLERLRSKGFASWLEVSEQRTAVAEARVRTRAADAYRDYVDQTAHSVSVACAVTDEAADKESIRMFLAGRLRLVGWLEANHATPELAAEHRRRLERLLPAFAGGGESTGATMLADAERRVTTLRARQNTQESEFLRQAELELDLLRAQHELARARQARGAILRTRLALLPDPIPRPPHEANSAWDAREGAPIIDAEASGLGEITRQVAKLDEKVFAADTGILSDLRNETSIRVAQLEGLANQPLDKPAELEQTRQLLAEMTERLSDRQAQQDQQVESKLHETERPTSLGDTDSPGGNGGSGWPVEVLRHATAVRHLLELKRAELQASVQRQSCTVRLEHWGELARRLQEVSNRGAARPGELEWAEARMRLCSKFLRLAEERENLARGEQRRFSRQFVAQYHADFTLVQAQEGQLLNRDSLLAGAAAWLTTGLLAGGRMDSPRPLSYLESVSIRDCAITNTEGYLAVYDWGPFAADRFAADGTAGFPAIRTRAVRPSGFGGGLRLATDSIAYPQALARSVMRDLDSCNYIGAAAFGPASSLPFRWSLPRYSDNYAYGIRRVESSAASRSGRRAGPYGGPWFLPGSTTNYR